MDYLRYYLNCLLPLAAIAGFLLGDQWVWLGIGTLPLLLLADALSPQDYAPRNIKNGALADVVIYVQMLLVLATFAAFGWRAHVGFDPALGNLQPWIASAAALIWVGLGANVGAAHELMHRHNPLAAFIGKLGFGIIGAPNRDISHTVTHHLYFDTERDFDTARRGESVYRFVPRCIWGNTVDEFEFERRRLAAQGLAIGLPHGSEAEQQAAQRIAAGIGAAAQVWPRLDLGRLADRLAGCAGVIGVDSGLSHIAVALDLPHVQLYNFDTAWRTGPHAAHQRSVVGMPCPGLEAVWQAWQQVRG